MPPRPELPPPHSHPQLRHLPAIWFLGLSSLARLTLTMQVLGLSPTPTKASSGHTDPGSPSATPNRASSVYVDPGRSSVIPFQVLLQLCQSQQLPNLTGPPLNRWLQAGRAAASSLRPPLTIQPLYTSLWRPAPQLAGVGRALQSSSWNRCQ